jgi:parvulin-like peptidyl-prolyl isomerase
MPSLSIARVINSVNFRRSALACVVICMAQVALAQATPKDPLVAKVNGTEIRRSDLAIAEEAFGPALLPKEDKARREFLVNYLSDMILVANAARKSKLPDDGELQRRLAFTRNKVLMEKQLVSVANAAVSEDALHKVYDEAVKKGGGEIETRVRNILFRFDNPADEAAVRAAEARAAAALERIRSGEDFVAVASETTEAPAGRMNGGDLGFLSKAQMGLEFSEAASTLAVGGVSGLIRTAFGWHIIKIEDKRERAIPAFDKVRKEIELVVMRRAQVELVNRLRAAAKIERLDQGEPTPANTSAIKKK